MDEKNDMVSHHTGTRKGEEMRSEDQQEPGREHTGKTQTGRPTGKTTGRFSTGINPDAEEPIMPGSPVLPPA